MKKLLLLVLLVSCLPVVLPAGNNCSYIIFFYSETCHVCSQAEPVLEGIESDYNVIIDKRELHKSGNSQLFQAYLDMYNVPSNKWGYTPTTFVNDMYIVGYNSNYKSKIIDEVTSCEDTGCVCPFNQTLASNYGASSFPEVNNTIGYYSGGNSTHPNTIDLTLPTILSAGLVDSINPCAFAVMIFLLTYLLNIGSRKKVLKVGSAYIISVFVTYLLAGLGLLLFVQSTQVSSVLYNIAAVIALIAGVINVKDFFFYDKGFSLRIPEKFKPMISKWSKRASVPAAVILGLLVSAFELPCTGGVYLAILGLLSKNFMNVKAVAYLGVYNFVFVLPLIILLLLVYYGYSTDKLEEWRRSKRNYMKLVSGVFMILLAVLMIKEVL